MFFTINYKTFRVFYNRTKINGQIMVKKPFALKLRDSLSKDLPELLL